jgi:hypothetical protein
MQENTLQNRPTKQHAFVALSKLQEFFQVFPVLCPLQGCEARCKVDIYELLMTFVTKFTCNAGHSSSWCTGEMQRNRGTPEIPYRLFTATLCAGLSFTQLCEICRVVGLRQPTVSNFYRFQRGGDGRLGWLDAVLQTWDEQQRSLQNELAMQCADFQRSLQTAHDSATQASEVCNALKKRLDLETEVQEPLLDQFFEGGVYSEELKNSENRIAKILDDLDTAREVERATKMEAQKLGEQPKGIVVMVSILSYYWFK